MDQPNEEKDLEIENDPIVKELMTEYGKQLDTVISKSYKFVDIKSDEIPANQFMIEPSQVEHSISFHFLSEPHQTEKHNRKIGRQKLWKPKPKFCEDITYEDMCSVVVTGDWVLNKKGLYGKGRERRSELVTGAIHSPALKKCNNKKQTQA